MHDPGRGASCRHPTARVRAAAERAAGVLGLPLEVVVVGDALLEYALGPLVTDVAHGATPGLNSSSEA